MLAKGVKELVAPIGELASNIRKFHAEHGYVRGSFGENVLISEPPIKVQVCGLVLNGLQDVDRQAQQRPSDIILFRTENESSVGDRTLIEVNEREICRECRRQKEKVCVNLGISRGGIATISHIWTELPYLDAGVFRGNDAIVLHQLTEVNESPLVESALGYCGFQCSLPLGVSAIHCCLTLAHVFP